MDTPQENESQRRSTRSRPATKSGDQSKAPRPPAPEPGPKPRRESARVPPGDREAPRIQPRSLSDETYEDLRRRAGRVINGRKAFEPRSLVNRAWLRLGRYDRAAWKSRSHFLNVYSIAMHQILIDELRRKKLVLLPMSVLDLHPHLEVASYLAVNDILERLKKFDPRQHQIVWNKVFCGMTNKENAKAMGVSESTIEAEWRHASAWLRTQLEKTVDKSAGTRRPSRGTSPKPPSEDR